MPIRHNLLRTPEGIDASTTTTSSGGKAYLSIVILIFERRVRKGSRSNHKIVELPRGSSFYVARPGAHRALR